MVLPLLLMLALVLLAALPVRAQEEGDDLSTADDGSTAEFLDSSSSGSFNDTNSTAIVSSSSSSSTGARSSSSSTGHVGASTGGDGGSDGGGVVPGGSIGKGDTSFGSTDAVFLTTVRDVWIGIILYTMIFTACAFVVASFHAIRVNKSVKWLWLWLPPLMGCVGGGVGFVHGALSAVLIAAIAIAIPYPVGIDIAAGLGIGQAICIVYFHLGRADFIHR